MSDSLVPPVVDPPIVDPGPVPRHERRCEGCGCKIDVRGRIIERGDKLRAFIDGEDTIIQLRKDVKAAVDARTALETELAEARRRLMRYESRKFGEAL